MAKRRAHNKGKKCQRKMSVYSPTLGRRVKVCASYKRKSGTRSKGK